MGQTSNILTLKKTNYNGSSFNVKEFLTSTLFIKVLKKAFDNKGVYITKNSLTKSKNTIVLNIDAFYKSKYLIKIRQSFKRKYLKNKRRFKKKFKKKKKKLSKRKKRKKLSFFKKESFAKKAKFYRLLKIVHYSLKTNLLVIKWTLVNKFEISDDKYFYFEKFQKFKRTLFTRRLFLFYDFIKLTSLFIKKRVNVEMYCDILGIIFKNLSKRSHAKFFAFVKILLPILTAVKYEESKILGVKLNINGKLKGKLRANTFKYSYGKISGQTIASRGDLSKVHIFTLYGTFGLTLSVNFGQKIFKRKRKNITKKTKKLLKPERKAIKAEIKVSKPKISTKKTTKTIDLKDKNFTKKEASIKKETKEVKKTVTVIDTKIKPESKTKSNAQRVKTEKNPKNKIN